MKGRRSYSGLMRKPVWGLFDGSELVATVRADSREDAQALFDKHELRGTHIRRRHEATARKETR